MSRHLLGTGLANQLALPRGSWKERMTVELELWIGWTFVHFGRAYRRGWEMDRQGWFREVIPLLVLYNLGERRSTFAWRKEERREEKLGQDEGEEPVSRVFMLCRVEPDPLSISTGRQDGKVGRSRGATPVVLAHRRDGRRHRRWSCRRGARRGLGWAYGLPSIGLDR